MPDIEIVDLGATTLNDDTNVPLVQSRVGTGNQEQSFGEIPVMQALGITSIPFPANENGNAQGVRLRVPGWNGVIVGARDARTADVYGQGRPGDTFVHGTGPEHKSQIRCQEKALSLVIEDVDGFNVVILMDGKNKKLQISGWGHMWQMSDDDGCSFVERGGAGVIAKDGALILKGSQVFIGEGARVPVHAGPGAGTTSLPSLSVLVPP